MILPMRNWNFLGGRRRNCNVTRASNTTRSSNVASSSNTTRNCISRLGWSFKNRYTHWKATLHGSCEHARFIFVWTKFKKSSKFTQLVELEL